MPRVPSQAEDAALHEEALETTELLNNTELFELRSMCQVNTKWPNVFKVKKYEMFKSKLVLLKG